MSKKVNYIVACYMGGRRQLDATPMTYVKNHLKWLATAKNIGDVMFVFNDSPQHRLQQIEAIELVLQKNYNFLTRANHNISYGAWKDALRTMVPTTKSNYSFLIEDDYIPSTPNIMSYFIKEMDDKTGFVASYYEDEDNWHGNQPHAAISNGLISHTPLKELIKSNKPIFYLNSKDILNKEYHMACNDQKIFLNNIEKLGYQMKDITNNNYTLFYDAEINSQGIHLYGNKNGKCLIKPNFPHSSLKNYSDDSYNTRKFSIPPQQVVEQ